MSRRAARLEIDADTREAGLGARIVALREDTPPAHGLLHLVPSDDLPLERCLALVAAAISDETFVREGLSVAPPAPPEPERESGYGFGFGNLSPSE